MWTKTNSVASIKRVAPIALVVFGFLVLYGTLAWGVSRYATRHVLAYRNQLVRGVADHAFSAETRNLVASRFTNVLGKSDAHQTDSNKPSTEAKVADSAAANKPQPAPSLQSEPPANPVPPPVNTSPPPAASNYFSTIGVGQALPSDDQCAQRVRRNSWEPKPENTAKNSVNLFSQGKRISGSYIAQFSGTIESRVTGNFTGTTDEILQWGACKWGFDEENVRAVAYQESTWRQGHKGDCNLGKQTQFGFNDCDSVGMMQVRGADIPATHKGTWPYVWDSTAFNVDYALAVRRLCFEGLEPWLGNGYAAGDEWGCIGRWFSGDWYKNSGNYLQLISNHLQNRPWVAWGYPGH